MGSRAQSGYGGPCGNRGTEAQPLIGPWNSWIRAGTLADPNLSAPKFRKRVTGIQTP
jgi:hypothetical protein